MQPDLKGRLAITLNVKVVSASSRNAISGWLGETLKIRVTAPAERGKANAAVERILADALGIPTECVRVIRGRASPRKIVEVEGILEAEVHRRLR